MALSISGDLAADLGMCIGGLWQQMAEVSLDIDSVAVRFRDQSQKMAELNAAAEGLSTASEKIGETAKLAQQVSDTVSEVADNSRNTLARTQGEIDDLVNGVRETESHLQRLTEALIRVTQVSESIEGIARQTRLLALNASIEAARAGELGKGFAVVAGEVKGLAQKTSEATRQIADTVRELSELAARVTDQNSASLTHADAVMTATGELGDSVDDVHTLFSLVVTHIEEIVEAGAEVEADREKVTSAIAEIAAEVIHESEDLGHANTKLDGLLADTDALISLSLSSGIALPDSHYIDIARDGAAKVAQAFESAVDKGEIAIDDLFDEDYRPVAGTNPPQVTTRFTTYAGGVLPRLLQSVLASDQRIACCAAIDRNGYLPAHDRPKGKPGEPDGGWNEAKSCSRRIINDDDSLEAARSTRDFMLKTYRRTLCAGDTKVVKDIAAPITVKGRHWGAFRLEYA